MFFQKRVYELVGNDQSGYAIKSPSGKYLDLVNFEYWWSKETKFFKDCWTKDKNLAEVWHLRMNS